MKTCVLSETILNFVNDLIVRKSYEQGNCSIAFFKSSETRTQLASLACYIFYFKSKKSAKLGCR
jgi:hypothetical protein